ncbi:putative sugar transporter SWEET1 [Apostichopus japonicus]|uniref:Sugar transporter SWEET1 n=1 Tax=Stichopus japonicus TaxID=307972 RepID=A0A2G8KX36_STIJA|nr:putative sugar transporter SWEET1 [Apostichopus japonicus]
MDAVSILSLACITVTIISFTAGMPDFIIILKRKHTGSTPFLPFLMGFITNIGCLLYGMLKWDFTILVVNSVGSVLHVFYVLVYLSYSSNKLFGASVLFNNDMYWSQLPLEQFTIATLLMVGLYLYLVHVVVDPRRVESLLGLATCVLILFANVSPMAELR